MNFRYVLSMTIVGCLASVAVADVPASGRVPDANHVPLVQRQGAVRVTEHDAASLRPVDAGVDSVVVTSMTIDPDGHRLAVAGDDQIIRLIDAATLETTGTMPAVHRDRIRSMNYGASGRLVTGGNDGRLIVWEPDGSIAQRYDNTPPIATLRFDPTGQRLAAVGFDTGIYLLGSGSSREPLTRCRCGDLRGIAFGDSGRQLVVGGRDGKLRVVDTESGDHRQIEVSPTGRVGDLVFEGNTSMLLVVGEDGCITRVDAATGQIASRSRLTTGRLFCVAYLGDQMIAAAGSDDVVWLVQFSPAPQDTGRVVATLIGHQGSIDALVYHEGQLYSAGFDATVRRWDVDAVLRHSF